MRPTALELRMGKKRVARWLANKKQEQNPACDRCGTTLIGTEKNYCPKCQE